MADDFASCIRDAFAADGAAVDLGRAVRDGQVHPDAPVLLPASMCNRHGLIAGATGMGRTK